VGINQNRANRYVEHFLRTGALSEVMGLPRKAGALEVLPEQMLGESKIDFQVERHHYIEVKTPLSWLDPVGHPRRKEVPRQGWKPSRLSPRLDRHFTSLAAALRKTNRLKQREKATASVIMVFLGDTEPFARQRGSSLRWRQAEPPTAQETPRRKKRKTGDSVDQDAEGAPATPPPKRMKAVLRPPDEMDTKDIKAFRKRLKQVEAAVGAAEEAGLRTFQLNLRVGVEEVDIIDFFELEQLIPGKERT